MAESIKTRVNRGIRKLDKDMPGWAAKVNTNSLEMGSNSMCILGQLAGRKGDAYDLMEKLGLNEDQLETHGFQIDYDSEDQQDILWKEAVSARKAEAKAAKKQTKKAAPKKKAARGKAARPRRKR